MTSINSLQIEKDNKKLELHEMYKKIFQIENDIINIDNKLASFSDNIIFETLQLSEQQNKIVQSTEDYILVVACPGSGKTHTLISRYIKLILDDIYKPEEIILITFTKKAGQEMLNRVSKLLPNKLPQYVGSLHGLSYKVLQEYMDINFSVLDEKDVTAYIKELLFDVDMIDIDIIRSKAQSIFDQASVTYPFNINSVLKKNNLEKYTKQFNQIYKLYQAKKKKENVVDFNDLMIQFSKFLDTPKGYQYLSQIKYVFFDEYQDVNPIQNYILKKFASNSRIMVVGDDAQSIYSFRGSSVDYILNFDKEFDNNKSKMFLLEENYRSTPLIVNYCQNIIQSNMNQFPKKVVSKQEQNGVMPCIYSFKTYEDEYKWITNDIISKMENGTKLSQMVILSRKNNLLNDIELHLLAAKIPVAKNLGSSLLDKPYIKDFLSFIIILTNLKSSIHLKRVISLYPGYGVKRSNYILELDSDYMKALHIYTTKTPDSSLLYLYKIINDMKKIKSDMEKAKLIIIELQRLYVIKKEPNIDEKILDIYNLLNYLKNSSSLQQFINDLYLNQEIETNLENVLYLTTIHGSKGLEWEHVYVIDIDASNFPSIRPKYYMDEMNEIDEERRLFYVAASRAKKYLTLTFNHIAKPSPFVQEIKSDIYNACYYMNEKIQNNYTFNISKDIMNYLKFTGYSNITPQLLPLVNNRSNIHKTLDLPNCIETMGNKMVIGNFMDYLISKMIQISFPRKIKKFDLPLIHKDTSFPQKIYLEYIDIKTDWRNILEHIFFISCYKNTMLEESEKLAYHDFLICQSSFNFYIELEKGLCKLINTIKPKEISTHYNCTMGDVHGEIDILCDNTIIEVKCCLNNMNEIATVPYIGQVLLYAYLLKKKNINPTNMILYTPFIGEVNMFDISKIDLSKFKNTIYK
jgi:DNA helicase-2/ATP-dependent DNA helicase PcrA